MVGPDDALGQLGPGIGVLVRAAGAAEDGDRTGTAGVDGVADSIGGGGDGLRPRHLDELVAAVTRLAHERRAEAVLAVHRLEVEAAAVAHPSPVDGVVVDAL